MKYLRTLGEQINDLIVFSNTGSDGLDLISMDNLFQSEGQSSFKPHESRTEVLHCIF